MDFLMVLTRDTALLPTNLLPFKTQIRRAGSDACKPLRAYDVKHRRLRGNMTNFNHREMDFRIQGVLKAGFWNNINSLCPLSLRRFNVFQAPTF